MIKHILADGTQLNSIEGIVIPATGKTEAVYHLIARMIAEGGVKGNSSQQQKYKEEAV